MIGRDCINLTGREARKYLVVVNNLDHNFVLIDGTFDSLIMMDADFSFIKRF